MFAKIVKDQISFQMMEACLKKINHSDPGHVTW